MAASTPSASLVPRVALAGFYDSGNFGDDLSAVLFGLTLRRFGIPCAVYGLCEPYARRFGFERAPNPDRLLDGAGALVWGGGGLLVSWSPVTYRLLYAAAASRLDRLVRAALHGAFPVLLASVGGDGRPLQALRPRYKADLVAAARSVTVRNPQDRDSLRQLNRDATYFPDISWGLSRVLPLERRRGGRLRIGIDLYPSNLVRQGALHLLPRLQAAVTARQDCDFVCVDTTNASRRPYRGIGGVLRGANVSRYQFRDLHDDLAFVGSLDAVFSSRFHLPIVAMQCGVPAFSIIAERKTRLLYENLGLERFCVGRDRLGDLLARTSGGAGLEGHIRGFEFPDVARLGAASLGHGETLRDALEGLARPAPAASNDRRGA